jgi:hypothetical protein
VIAVKVHKELVYSVVQSVTQALITKAFLLEFTHDSLSVRQHQLDFERLSSGVRPSRPSESFNLLLIDTTLLFSVVFTIFSHSFDLL